MKPSSTVKPTTLSNIELASTDYHLVFCEKRLASTKTSALFYLSQIITVLNSLTIEKAVPLIASIINLSRGPTKNTYISGNYDVIFLEIVNFWKMIQKCTRRLYMGINQKRMITEDEMNYFQFLKFKFLASRRLFPGKNVIFVGRK